MARLEIRAIVSRWPIEDKQRARIVKRLMGIIENKRATRREATAAARALIAADALSLAEEKANDGYTQEEILARWKEAVAAGVAAELARRERGRITGPESATDEAATVVPAQAVSETAEVPGPGVA